MPFVKVLRGGQITLPKNIREILGINEGDVLEAKMEKHKVVLKPKVMVDKIPESELELSEKGEKKIKEALEAYERGEVKEFSNVNDLIKDSSVIQTVDHRHQTLDLGEGIGIFRHQ